MTDLDEDISIKDRYESLKLLCREQILANEVLKNELERLRRSIHDISRQRTYLLDKMLAFQKCMPSALKSSARKCRVSSLGFSENMEYDNQSRICDSLYGTSSKRSKVDCIKEFSVSTPSTSWNRPHEGISNRNTSKCHAVFSSSSTQGHSSKIQNGLSSSFSKSDVFRRKQTINSSGKTSQNAAYTSDFPTGPGPSQRPSFFDDEPPVIYSSAKVKIPSSIFDSRKRLGEHNQFKRSSARNNESEDNIANSFRGCGDTNSTNCAFSVSPAMEKPLHYKISGNRCFPVPGENSNI